MTNEERERLVRLEAMFGQLTKTMEGVHGAIDTLNTHIDDLQRHMNQTENVTEQINENRDRIIALEMKVAVGAGVITTVLIVLEILHYTQIIPSGS